VVVVVVVMVVVVVNYACHRTSLQEAILKDASVAARHTVINDCRKLRNTRLD
jgi:hypothetical protein